MSSPFLKVVAFMAGSLTARRLYLFPHCKIAVLLKKQDIKNGCINSIMVEMRNGQSAGESRVATRHATIRAGGRGSCARVGYDAVLTEPS
jgi:hypothetical protein